MIGKINRFGALEIKRDAIDTEFKSSFCIFRTSGKDKSLSCRTTCPHFGEPDDTNGVIKLDLCFGKVLKLEKLIVYNIAEGTSKHWIPATKEEDKKD